MSKMNWRTIYKNNIAAGIKAFRAEHSLTQARLCVALGVDLKTITNWENGVTEPKPYLFLALERIEGI